MRLINADALYENVERSWCVNCNNYNGVRCSSCSIDDVLSFIEIAPTIEIKDGVKIPVISMEDVPKIMEEMENNV